MPAVATATAIEGPVRLRPDGLRRAQTTDREVVAALRAGDTRGLERMFETYGGMIASWARRAGTESEDVIQDVMLKVWRAAARLDPDTNLPALLKTVTQNTIRNRWRTQSRRPVVPVGLEPGGGTASDPMAAQTDRIAVEQALGRLNPRERRCLELLYVSDLPVADVADRLGVSAAAAKSLAARARRRIRGELERMTTPAAG